MCGVCVCLWCVCTRTKDGRIYNNGDCAKYVDRVTGADFTKGLKSRFRLKSKTLVLNFVKRMLSLWS